MGLGATVSTDFGAGATVSGALAASSSETQTLLAQQDIKKIAIIANKKDRP
jgi:hypothetical protein